MLVSNTLFGEVDKVAIAIARIKEFEPPEGYWGATSFGKDSQVIMELSEMAGVKVEWHHALTTIDPPELIKFGKRNYPNVIIDKPKIPLLHLVPNKGFPMSRRRWCCELYKESSAKGRTILLGVRWEESQRRKSRKMVEICFKDPTKRYVNPIIDWTEKEVWQFLKSRGLESCELYLTQKRIGCIMCPLASVENRRKESERWPGMARAWKRAFQKLYDNRGHTEAYSRWKNADEMFNWWMSKQPGKGDPNQTIMFE